MNANPEKTDLTRPSRDTVKERALRDPEFLDALLDEMDEVVRLNSRLLSLIDDAVRDLWRPATYRSREEVAQFLVDILAEGWSSHNATLAPKLVMEDDDDI